MDVYLPDDLPRQKRDVYTLDVTTAAGEHRRGILPVRNGGDQRRLSFLVGGFPPDTIQDVSLRFYALPKISVYLTVVRLDRDR
jgi:hypothetical protein